MKKICIFFTLLSFSLFIIPVKADTYNYTIPSVLTNLSEQDINNMISVVNSYGVQYSDYFIKYTSSSSIPFTVYSIQNPYIDNNYIKYGNCRQYVFSSDFSTLSQASRNFNCGYAYTGSYIPLISSGQQTVFIVYSNFSLTFPNSDTIFNYTYIDKVYTMPNGTDMKLYTIKDMYIDYNTDPYPLFTSFFDIVIEKLQLICDFFTSSYIYLSIFVVLMFYFIILLIRRLI